MMRLGLTVTFSIATVAAAAIGATFGPVPTALVGLVAAIGLAAIGGMVAWGSCDPALQMFGKAVTRADRADAVALTFDDGPDPDTTPALLEALASAEARATFYLLVDRAEAHPELARAIAQDHEVGLHGVTHHPWLTIRPVPAGTEELTDGRRRLEAVIGRPVTTFRPPFGVTSPRLVQSMLNAGMRMIWCSVRTRDGGSLTAQQVRERCSTASGGDIVLLHEGRASTLEAMPAVLADLRARGLRALTVEDLCRSA